MAGADLNRIMDNLRVSLPGAIDATIQMELFNVLDDFFQGTNIWREDIELSITPATTSYDLSPSTNARVVRVIGVRDSNDRQIKAAIDLKTDELELAEAPSSATSYFAEVSLTIKDPVNSEGFPVIPPWIIGLYKNTIIDGVLGRMMAQPAKPYSNTSLAAFHERRFTSGVSVARVEAQRRYVFGGQVWRFPQQFNRRKTYR
jgi:hypothetical protein